MEIWIAAISAGVAVLSLVMNWMIIRRQLVIQAEQISATLDGEKAKWLAEVLTTFGDASALVQSRIGVYTEAEFLGRRIDIANRFSALADHGRVYFPNVAPDEYGNNKLYAFRGKRRPVLDAVILAHDVVASLDTQGRVPNELLVSLLFKLRRVVVSDVQMSIDPHRREALLEQARRMRREGGGVPREEVRALIGEAQALPNISLSFTNDDLADQEQNGRG